MPRTPKNAKVNYAVSANFTLDVPCQNQRLIDPEGDDQDATFLRQALETLKSLAEEGLDCIDRGDSLPLTLEIYDADLFDGEGNLIKHH